MCEEALSEFSFVLEYDRGPLSKSATENMCNKIEIQYIGLSSYVPDVSALKGKRTHELISKRKVIIIYPI